MYIVPKTSFFAKVTKNSFFVSTQISHSSPRDMKYAWKICDFAKHSAAKVKVLQVL